MKELPHLEELSHAEKDALIEGLWQELQTLRAEVEKLKQKRVKKTARNSSLPPAKGFKSNQNSEQSTALKGEERESHHHGGRELSQQPAQVVVAQAKSCPHCGVEVELSAWGGDKRVRREGREGFEQIYGKKNRPDVK